MTLTKRVEALEAMVGHYTRMISDDHRRLAARLDKLETPSAFADKPYKITVRRTGATYWFADVDAPSGAYIDRVYGVTRRRAERKAKRLVAKHAAPPAPSERIVIEVRP